MRKIEIPKNVNFILEKLEEAGYEAYAVGGCVRDSLLGRKPMDWDITTSARPEEVKAIFHRTIDTGIQHGTVTVLLPSGKEEGKPVFTGYEVTTYRIDGEYNDGRHPSHVIFTPSLREDLARRDFTINAMALHHRTGIVDEFEGLSDLENKVIRAVGDPVQRFTEDALRMLRAVRFSAQLDFVIEEETYRAIGALAPRLCHVSKERIAVELTKLLLSQHPERIRLLFDSGLAEYIAPDFLRIPADIRIPSGLPEEKYVRWAVLLRHYPGVAAPILRALKLDNETIHDAAVLSKMLSEPLPDNAYALRKQLSLVGIPFYLNLLDTLSCLEQKEGQGTEQIARLREQTLKVKERGDCLSVHELTVGGKELMALGVERGPMVGRLLQWLLDQVLEEPERNQREHLLLLLREKLSGERK